jgi:hypothetical protein
MGYIANTLRQELIRLQEEDARLQRDIEELLNGIQLMLAEAEEMPFDED